MTEVLDLPDGSFVDWSIRTPTGRRVEIGWYDGPAVMVDVPELEFEAWHDTLNASPVAAAAWVEAEWDPAKLHHHLKGEPIYWRHGFIPVAVHEEILHFDAADVQAQLHHDGSILLTVHPDQPPHPQHGDLRDHWQLHTEDVPDLVDGLDLALQRAENGSHDPVTVPTTGGDVDLTPRRDGGVDAQFGPANDLATLRLAPADVEHLSSHLEFLAGEHTPGVAQTVDVSPTLGFDLLSTHRVGIRLGGSDTHEPTTLTQDDIEGVEQTLRRFAAQPPHRAAPVKKPGVLGRMLGRKAPALEPGGADRTEVASQRLRPGLSVSWWSDGSASIEATGDGTTEMHIPAGQVQAAISALGQLLGQMRAGPVSASAGHRPYRYRHGWIPLFMDLADLEEAVKSGVKYHEPLSDGEMGVTERLHHNNGAVTVSKTFVDVADTMGPDYPPKRQADAEELGAKLGHSIGAPVPRVLRTAPDAIVADEIPGETGDAQRRREFDAAEARTPVVSPDELRAMGDRETVRHARVVATPAGIRLGTFDVLTGNWDRGNPQNWMITPDGTPAGIDHAFLFDGMDAASGADPPDIDTMGPFAVHFVQLGRNGTEWADNPLTRADIGWLRKRLADVEPEFTAAGRHDWWEFAAARLEAIAAHATGTESRFAP